MPSGFEEAPRGLTGYSATVTSLKTGGDTVTAKLKVGPGGRVVIPVALREKLGVSEGDVLMATFESGELRLVSLAESVRRAQAMVRARVPSGASLVDDLLAERRREVEAEKRRG